MNWFFIAILAPLFWATGNFIDKYLISKYFQSKIGTLIIYSALMGLPIALLIVIFNPKVLILNPLTAIFIILNSFLLIIYLFPYLKALNKTDTSVVIPIFQTIPVFSYILALLFLGEILTKMQIIGSLLIIFGAIGISLKFSGKKIHLTKEVLLLQLLASFLIALNYFFFKLFAIQLNFWTVSFWQYIGISIFGIIILICVKKYRNEFIFSLKQNGKYIFGLNTLNEALNISALLLITFASLLAPLALVMVINGFQPLFVFLIGLLLTLFLPHIIKEEITKKIIIQKSIFIILMFIGAYLLNI